MNYIQSMRQYIGTKPMFAPGAAVVVFNAQHEILLQLRSDTKDWGLPGGSMELGDTFEMAARRELLEETGLSAQTLHLKDIVSGEALYVKYPHGDEVYSIVAVYEAENVTGEIVMDEESLALAYFPLTALPTLNPISHILLTETHYIDTKKGETV